MLNRNSAITEKYNIGKYPFEDKIEIIFSENRNLTIQQIAAWPEEMSNIETFFSDQLGVQKNIDFNKGEILKDNSLWRMEPSKWWLLGDTLNLPENLGTSINSANDEKCVFIHPDGNVLFFTSNGRENSIGSYDIYYCTGGHGKWSEPINIGYPINTFLEEKTISISKDGKTAYVGAYYDIESKGDADLFKIDISGLGIFEE